MSIHDIASEVYAALTSNKARTSLTMLGVVIGISSVIVMVGVGQGATASVTASVSSLGSDLLIISPGSSSSTSGVRGAFGSSTTLTVEDAEAIASSASTVKAVAPMVTSNQQVVYKTANTNSRIVGTTADYASVRNLTLSSGSFIGEQNVTSYSRVAVIGATISETLFGEDASPVGNSIKVGGIIFKIIGVVEASGGSTSDSNDYAIYVPMTTAQRYFVGSSGSSTSVSTIYAQASSSDTVAQAQEEVTALLLERHSIALSSDADFTVTTQEDLVSSLSSVSRTLTILLAAIASISLLVGGIGIMNMMLTTVTERTREIGLRKAIGAKRRDISLQFLSESVALTFLSGAIGVVLGILIAIIVTNTGLVTSDVTWQSVVLAFGICVVIGVVFGYYPASKAAKLKPIDALRYE